MIITGTIIPGLGIAGRDLGFPTANIAPDGAVVTPNGVYAGRMTVNGASYDAAICIGADGHAKVEAHLIGFSGDLLGAKAELHVVERVSDLVPWESAEHMRAKIADDIQRVTNTLRVYEAGPMCAWKQKKM